MKKHRRFMPMRFQDGGAGDGGGGSAGGAGNGGAGTSGDGGGDGGDDPEGDAGDGSGGAGGNELAVMKRKFEKSEKQRLAAEQKLKEAEDAKLSDEEKQRKADLDAAYERGKAESADAVKEAELRGEIRAAMSDNGIPAEFYDSFRKALGDDVEPDDVIDGAKALIEKGGVWAQFQSGGDGDEGGGVRKPLGKGGGRHKPDVKGHDGPDPFSQGGWNLTQQGRLLRSDPEQAKKLMARNGVEKAGVKPAAWNTGGSA